MASIFHFQRAHWNVVLACVCAALFQGSTRAQLPVAKLTSIFPMGGKAGSSVEVTVSGSDLEDLRGAWFDRPGLTGTAAGPASPQRVQVDIATNVPPGLYEIRIIGRFGISNPRRFVVSQWAETVKSETNSTAESAQTIEIPETINGRAIAGADSFYRVKLVRNQRVFIECLATSLDSRMFSSMTLYDGSGKELARSMNEDLLDFRAPDDGVYVLKLHDLSYRGGTDYFYRLSISAGPHIDFIWPPSAEPGTTNKFTIYGRNLPGGSPATNQWVDGKMLDQLGVQIEAPTRLVTDMIPSGFHRVADCVVRGFSYRLTTPEGDSNPYFFSYATAPVTMEQEPNNKPAQAQQVTLPCEYVGQFYPRGDSDWIAFDARKGDVYWVEAFSQRLGLPTAPFIFVQRITKNSSGEEKAADVQELYDYDTNVGGVEFNTTARDPIWRFEPSENATYRIEVRDRFRSLHDDARRIYRLSLRKEKPDFELVAVPQAPPPLNKDKKEATLWSPLLRRGETVPIKILLFRRDNFSGEVEVSITPLPAGITCAPALIPRNGTTALLMISAADDAPNWAGPLKIVGRGKVGELEITHAASGGTMVWQAEDYSVDGIQARLSPEPVLAVSASETAPISIRPEQTTLEAAQSGKILVPLKVLRSEDFRGALKLKAGGAKEWEALKEMEVDGKATNANFEIDLAQAKVEPGRYTVYFQGQSAGKYRKYAGSEGKVIEEEKKGALKDAEKTLAELPKSGNKEEDDKARAQAETKKQKAEKDLKDFTQLNQSRDVTYTTWSPAVILKVRPVAVSVAK